jgi:hypothetical protein
MKSSLPTKTDAVAVSAPSAPSDAGAADRPALKRRTVFAGVGAVGALAAAASLLPKAPGPAQAVAAVPQAVDADGGYRLTDHVKRYYQTARV